MSLRVLLRKTTAWTVLQSLVLCAPSSPADQIRELVAGHTRVTPRRGFGGAWQPVRTNLLGWEEMEGDRS